jgi:hypothetical protein
VYRQTEAQIVSGGGPNYTPQMGKLYFNIYFFMTSMFRLAAILDGPPSWAKKAGEREWGKPHFKIYLFLISMLRLAAILNETKGLEYY